MPLPSAAPMAPLGSVIESSVLPAGTSMVWMPPASPATAARIFGAVGDGGLTGCTVVPDGAAAGGAASAGGAPRSVAVAGGCAISGGGRGGHSVTDDDCAYAAAADPSTQAMKNARRTIVVQA